MRTLKFIVKGQDIRKDPACDFSGIARETEGYLKAEFSFDQEWDGCGKIAVFTKLKDDFPEKLTGNVCIIPAKALTYSTFSVHVIGVRPGYKIATNETEVKQDG